MTHSRFGEHGGWRVARAVAVAVLAVSGLACGDMAGEDDQVRQDAAGTCSPLSVANVTASGDDGNVPANVLDDNLKTRWSSFGKGQYITADLGATTSVCSASIAWYLGASRR